MNPDSHPDIVLKCSAATFAIPWTLGMLCWNGSFQPHEVVILAVGGAIGGFCWYWVMRGIFKLIRTVTTLANDNTLIWPTSRQSRATRRPSLAWMADRARRAQRRRGAAGRGVGRDDGL